MEWKELKASAMSDEFASVLEDVPTRALDVDGLLRFLKYWKSFLGSVKKEFTTEVSFEQQIFFLHSF